MTFACCAVCSIKVMEVEVLSDNGHRLTENTSEVASNSKRKWCFLLHCLYKVLFGHLCISIKLGPVTGIFHIFYETDWAFSFLQLLHLENECCFKSSTIIHLLKKVKDKCTPLFWDWYMRLKKTKNVKFLKFSSSVG